MVRAVALLMFGVLAGSCASSTVASGRRPVPAAPVPVTTSALPPATTRADGIPAAQQGTWQISPQAMAQIAAIMQRKGERTDVQRRISSQLLHAQDAAAGRAVVPGFTPALSVAADGRQRLDVRAVVTDALVAQIRAMGVDVLEANGPQRTLGLQARLDQVDAIAALPGVLFVSPAPEARLNSVASVTRQPRDRRALIASLRRSLARNEQQTNTGTVTSQGDATHRAAVARSSYGVNGTGVKIGVLSDGVGGLATSQASGDLPAVTVLSGQSGTGSEGTAMLEIIHDLAPGAQLYFATAFTSPTSFADNIRALRTAGCDIIIDDVYWTGESPFQDGQASGVTSNTNGGIITQAVKDVAADGALYFSSAGNAGNLTSATSGTWEGDFVDGGQVDTPTPVTGRIHSYGSQTYNSITAATTSLGVELWWSDPFGASSNDYDLFVLDSTGSTTVGGSSDFQTGTQDPYERVSGTITTGRRVVIVKYSGSNRFLHLSTNRGQLSIATSGEIHGHAATTATNSFGVAATAAASPGPYPNPHSTSNTVESFSSDGPRRIFFNANGTPITAGNFSSTGGQLLNKPDLTAADRVSVTGAGEFPTTFSGTSAAAPHAGAMAALAKSYPITTGQARTALLGSAIDIHSSGVDRDSGVGIVMADTTVQAAAGFLQLAFTDNPLQPGVTPIKAVHITEMRAYINTIRNRYSLGAYIWTDAPTVGTTLIKAVHITEMRTALNAAYTAAGRTTPTYTTITAGTTAISAAHIAELRIAIAAIY